MTGSVTTAEPSKPSPMSEMLTDCVARVRQAHVLVDLICRLPQSDEAAYPEGSYDLSCELFAALGNLNDRLKDLATRVGTV